jgi:hypothetical protein
MEEVSEHNTICPSTFCRSPGACTQSSPLPGSRTPATTAPPLEIKDPAPFVLKKTVFT